MDGMWATDAPVACIHPGWGPIVGRDAGVMRSWHDILANPASPEVTCASPRRTCWAMWLRDLHGARHPPRRGAARGLGSATERLHARGGRVGRVGVHQSSPVADELIDEPTRPSQLN